MMIMKRLLFLVSVCSLCMVGNSQNYQPEKHAVVKSDRGDGRLLSTYAIVHEMLKDTHPQYAYRSGMSAQDFTQWQDGVRAAMVEMYLANLHTSFLCNLIYPTFSRILLYSC